MTTEETLNRNVESTYSPWAILRVVMTFEGDWVMTSPPMDAVYAQFLLAELLSGTPRVMRAKVVPADDPWPEAG